MAHAAIELAILPRTAARRWMRFHGSLFQVALRLQGGFRMRHGCCHSTLLLGRELEDVIREQFAMISRIALE
jgi:hypothetical protein